jgi:hypothetical protein
LNVDMKGLTEGLYIVTAEADGKILRTKIVVAK